MYAAFDTSHNQGSVSQTFFRGGTPKIIVYIPRKREKNIKRWLLAHGEYSGISSCRTNILAILRGMIFFFGVYK
jgi:hypothetical protein